MRFRMAALIGVIVLSACGRAPTAPVQAPLQLDLVGPDSFPIVNSSLNPGPGCIYWWVLQASGTATEYATLTDGRLIRLVDGTPADTFYRWTPSTIQPLFDSPTFSSGEQQRSGRYATVGHSIAPFDFRVEFDYRVSDGRTGVASQVMRCVLGS